MDQFFEIVKSWSAIGQGFFFLLVISGILTVIRRIFYYTTVLFRGWPEKTIREI